MAGLGAPEGPGTPYTQAKPRQQRMETPFPVPPPHWGHPRRLHRCWHPNEKVNIEPKDLGMVGSWEHPERKFLPGASLAPPGATSGEGHPQPQGKGQTGEQARRNCGVCALRPEAERPFGHVVF